MNTIRIPLDEGAISDLCREYGVRELALFGSVLRDDFDPTRSDVDMLVEFAPESPVESLLDFIKVKHALDDLLGCEVDLVEKRALSPYIRNRVLESRRVICVFA